MGGRGKGKVTPAEPGDLTMQDVNKRRNPIRRQVERLERELNRLFSATPVDKEAVNVDFKLLMDAYSQLSSLDARAYELLASADLTEEQEDEEVEGAAVYKKLVESVRCKFEKLTTPVQSTPSETTACPSVAGDLQRLYRLPRVEIQKFSGKLTDWLGFWAQFGKIHSDQIMHDSDKIFYLVQSLEPGSEPHQIVSGYPLSGENYQKAVEALKRRYGNEDILLQVYVRDLLVMVISNVSAAQKVPFKDLFLKLHSHLRALKSLNLEKADPATWLYPLVESSLPEDILYNWNRSPLSTLDGSKMDPPRTRLDILMEYMEKEVQIRQRIEISKSFTAERRPENKERNSWNKGGTVSRRMTAVATDSSTTRTGECIFCGKGSHIGEKCTKAEKMPRHVKISILRRNRLCFSCFGPHMSDKCDARNLKCENCGEKHHKVICRGFKNPNSRSGEPPAKKSRQTPPASTSVQASNQVSSEAVSLQTVMVKVSYGGKERVLRAFLDSGSQRSYILKKTAEEMGLQAVSEERVVHTLFGGSKSAEVCHRKYEIRLKGLQGPYQTIVQVRDQDVICANLPRISRRMNAMLAELREKGVELTDVGDGCPEVELLIGADFYGKILTGDTRRLQGGTVAVHTKLGWTLVGEIREARHDYNMAMLSVDMAVCDSSVAKLWELEVMGIKDPVEMVQAKEKETIVKQKLFSQLTRDESGRYEVRLPWKEAFPFLPDNKGAAIKCLEAATRKLVANRMFEAYGNLFEDWRKEGFIEVVSPLEKGQRGHYLPHRAVVKTSSLTTPVRPVFNASCRSGRHPSLNNCLEKGSNYILLIPDVLLRFREKKIGFVADIRKAFLMIGVNAEDRDFLRFLWWKDDNMQDVVEYRHARVPFGAICSPFILGAVLEYHLLHVPEDLQTLGRKLFRSLYVDNCVSSEDTENDYQNFRMKATSILAEAQMDLRMWLSNINGLEDEETLTLSVLGLTWNRVKDVLYVDTSKIDTPEKISKRSVLSTIQKVFDPIGYTCPALLPMKLLLQRSWIQKAKWDEELPEVDRKLFLDWYYELSHLQEIQLKRRMTVENSGRDSWQLHTFTDASQLAYAAVTFLRTECMGKVSVQLISAKSRVAPVGGTTIPRMELLGCLIGARLAKSVKTALELENVSEFYWSDSSTALAWIRKNEQWGTFVGNRTAEIRRLTLNENWRFIPGELNPADFPSRGCSPLRLYQSRWWEGPVWLYAAKQSWIFEEEEADQKEVINERKRSAVVCLSVLEGTQRKLPFQTLVRITGWILRFCDNARALKGKSIRRSGELKPEELAKSKLALVKSIQAEIYVDVNMDDFCVKKKKKQNVQKLQVFKDEEGVLRVKTRLTYRKDDYNFKFPFLLPGRHPIVQQLIWDTHQAFCHAGVGFLVTYLRRNYWIVRARQSVRHVISRCFKCRKLSAKATVTEVPGLPEDRVRNGDAYIVCGVDLAGPFLLKGEKKVWLVIFTCALYRAVHLDLVSSLSTKAFVQVMEKFVKKCGRPEVVYSDNGTNFKGAQNLFGKMNWEEIMKTKGLDVIQWKFNPSTGSWWGGFWERLIRSVKDLLRRTLGKSNVRRNEFEKVLETVEEVLNGRPLTYLSEDPNDLEPLTPNMFIRPYRCAQFPEAEVVDSEQLRYRYRYVETLQRDLRQRWRKEYISMLTAKPQKPTRTLKVGELVVISQENKKRHEWDLARILELYPGKDGIARVAKVKTADGEYVRPIQRLHPLEMDMNDRAGEEKVTVVTRAGRKVNKPTRFS